MKKILLSLLSIGAVAVIAVAATGAFFSDVETSEGNLLQAGSIDLGIDNHSFYNGELNPGTTWRVDFDLSDDPPRQFFNFTDIKPGDWGEDTISLNVTNNESWLCADVTLTSDNDNGLVDPESDDGDVTPGPIGEGELADAVNWFWWADDGDNVYECDVEDINQETGRCGNESPFPDSEQLLPAGPMGLLNVGQTATVTLADSINNIWTNTSDTPLDPQDVRFIGKAWCFGDSDFLPYPQDGGNLQNFPITRPVLCDGSGVNNVTQTDSFTADISFRAVQSRNNEEFLCNPPTRIVRTQEGFGDGGWAGWSCPAGTTVVGGGIDSSTNPVGGSGMAKPGEPAVDGFTYPTYPHYTFGFGETGFVVHDFPGDGLGNTIAFHLDCL